MSKQRLLFITTGGTIASVRTAQGLKPVLTSEELLAHLPELQQLCCPETLNLCSIDSTDLGPEHWLMMAKAVQENYALYDGFIICHGTDTLAYSAAALSYLIQNADKPIILTGAQQPISNEITDAKKNLRDSVICALDPGSRGVMVVFGGHVIAGTRAKKNKTISYDAFASVNFPELALVQGDRLVASPRPVPYYEVKNPRYLLLQLMAGPTVSEAAAGRTSLLPAYLGDADILGFSAQDGVLLVNLSPSFATSSSSLDEAQERLLAYSMINTLCHATELRRIRFYFGSEPWDTVAGSLWWNGEFMENTSMVQP